MHKLKRLCDQRIEFYAALVAKEKEEIDPIANGFFLQNWKDLKSELSYVENVAADQKVKWVERIRNRGVYLVTTYFAAIKDRYKLVPDLYEEWEFAQPSARVKSEKAFFERLKQDIDLCRDAIDELFCLR